ncbi:hypothetical protein B0T22DRAFT_426676 [Podospora appendiculata]|uniref:Nucleoside-diphosphate-sugar epimerase n=1 Tax=Podospora appendiculata TaxID=314037 RepID=A0AAE0XA16_9PEZI|nr:hypothetical protein B0T22DRAFT_426676 [Podospora appendiculata]
MHLVLTGATGLVGSGVLDAMIKMADVTKISVLSRRPVAMAEAVNDPRVQVIIHKDYSTYDKALMDQIRDATGCVWAQGISQRAVDKEEYIKITKEYPLAFASAITSAQAAQPDKKPFNFVYVSGDGATFHPGALTPLYARVKGETELALAQMRRDVPTFRADSVRPSAVDHFDHDAVKPYIPVQGAGRDILMGYLLRPLFKRGVLQSRWSPTQPLGVFLTEMAMGKWDEKTLGTKGVEKLEGGSLIVENSAFIRAAGLDGKKGKEEL